MIGMLEISRRLAGLTHRERVDARATRERNVGAALMEWPERADLAADMLRAHAGHLGAGTVVADWGCGRQTVRRLLPPAWQYVPYDRIRRSEDTRLHDFDAGPPAGRTEVVICLGLLEYLDEPWRTLGAAIEQSDLCVFSYVGPASAERRRRNGWKWTATFVEVEAFIDGRGAVRLAYCYRPTTGAVYVVGRRPACTQP